MSSIAALLNSARKMSMSQGWMLAWPHGVTIAGEACPPEPPAQFMMTLQKTHSFFTVPVLMQSASNTEENNLQSYLPKVRGEVQLVPFASCGGALSQGAIRAYYRLPEMNATASGQTGPLGLKIAFGVGGRVLKVPEASQQAYATAPMTVAGGNLREYRLSHLPAPRTTTSCQRSTDWSYGS